MLLQLPVQVLSGQLDGGKRWDWLITVALAGLALVGCVFVEPAQVSPTDIEGPTQGSVCYMHCTAAETG